MNRGVGALTVPSLLVVNNVGEQLRERMQSEALGFVNNGVRYDDGICWFG
jgi:hypothetical protein